MGCVKETLSMGIKLSSLVTALAFGGMVASHTAQAAELAVINPITPRQAECLEEGLRGVFTGASVSYNGGSVYHGVAWHEFEATQYPSVGEKLTVEITPFKRDGSIRFRVFAWAGPNTGSTGSGALEQHVVNAVGQQDTAFPGLSSHADHKTADALSRLGTIIKKCSPYVPQS